MITTEEYKKAKALIEQYQKETKERVINLFTGAIEESGLLGGRKFHVKEALLFNKDNKYASDITIQIVYED